MNQITDWFTSHKPHFGGSNNQRFLRDKANLWSQMHPNRPCEVASDVHICRDDWCAGRQAIR
jgi:hypothetical protein